jgi:AraC-like DNA-binding protein
MTEQSFSRFFKKRTKKSFSQFLSDLRIAQACQILIQSDKPVSDIANLCGYNSSSHFCKAFKDHTGVSPFQYRTSMNKS